MSNASFAIDTVSVNLYSAAAGLQGNGNLLISPISILYGTLLVYLGSRGKTQSNLDSALHFSDAFGKSTSDISAGFGSLMNQLKINGAAGIPRIHRKDRTQSLGKDVAKSANENNTMQLALANGVFIQNGLNIQVDYLNDVTQNLKVSPTLVNFIKTPEQVRSDINTWVEERTGGRIKDLIPTGAIDKESRLVLANALYFKGAWESPFPNALTNKGPFQLLDGKKTDVTLMFIHKIFKYQEDSILDIQYVEIPYVRSEASMLVFLPRKPAGLRSLEKALTPQAIEALAKSAKKIDVELTLPKFKFESNFDLQVLLGKLGVQDVFADTADLSGIVATGNLKVTGAFHKTFIDVDENGTEAAAATALVVSNRLAMISMDPPVVFRADHPFVFAIRHNPSKAIIFMGRVEKF